MNPSVFRDQVCADDDPDAEDRPEQVHHRGNVGLVVVAPLAGRWAAARGPRAPVVTGLLVAVIYSVFHGNGRFRLSVGNAAAEIGRSFWKMRFSALTIMSVLSLAYVMNTSGQTISIGTWVAGLGAAFAFLSPVLGWLGTAVTGSDTSANALFSNLGDFEGALRETIGQPAAEQAEGEGRQDRADDVERGVDTAVGAVGDEDEEAVEEGGLGRLREQAGIPPGAEDWVFQELEVVGVVVLAAKHAGSSITLICPSDGHIGSKRATSGGMAVSYQPFVRWLMADD